MNDSALKPIKEKDKSLIILVIIGLATIAIWQFSFGRLFLYPFVILGTWFHEMGHGIAAMVLGGNFIRLEINADGSGTAYHTANTILGGLGNAFIAGAGPIGPTIAGSIFVLFSAKTRFSRITLFLLGIFLILSDIIWVRTLFGFLMILAFGALFIYISLYGKDKLQKITMQFLGIQAFLSLYLSIDYLFSTGGTAGGNSFSSDTQVISQSLLLPNWFWASIILLFSLYMIIFSIRSVYKSAVK